MSTTTTRAWIAAGTVLLGAGTAGAQTGTTTLNLSAEARQYVQQNPTEVLQAMKARITRTAGSLAACPAIPPGGYPGATNGHYYFLSEVGGCAQLACFLKQVPTSVHAYSTLIVDQACTGASAIKETLVLPERFTLAGVGIEGAGVLGFDLPDNVAAIRFKDSTDVVIRMSAIRDLNLSGGCCNQVGIDVSNSQFVYVENVRLHNFAFGLLGDNAYSIFVDQTSVHNNAFNIVMGDNTTSWRVRDSVANQGLIGIQMNATARGHVVSGGRVEANWGPGIRIDGQMNVVNDTWFEGNGIFFNTHYGVWVTSQGQKNRVLSSLFSSQLIGDDGDETRSCFNMSFAPGSADVNQC